MIKNKYYRKWYDKHRVQHIENMKDYYRRHKEERLNYQYQYYEDHRQHHNLNPLGFAS